MTSEDNTAGRDIELVITETEHGTRLDSILASQLDGCSRNEIQGWIKEGRITVDEISVKASHRVSAGEVVLIHRPAPPDHLILPEDIPLAVVYEDADLLVVDKPAGMVVHPAHGNWTGTLVNALLHRYPEFADRFDDDRPGIVHRLDKDTSGLLVVAKNEAARQFLQAQFKSRTVDKVYIALVYGQMETEVGRIDAPIGRDPRQRKQMAIVSRARGGRQALTEFRAVEYFDEFALVEAKILTGRTHQIRVHFAYIGHPLVGDPVYGPRKKRLACPRQFLHAHRLVFRAPSSEAEVDIISDLPQDLQHVLDALRSHLRWSD